VNIEQKCLSLKPNNPHVLHLSPLRGVPSFSIGRAGCSGSSTALGSVIFKLLSSSSPANYLLYALMAATKRAYKVSCSGGSAFMCKTLLLRRIPTPQCDMPHIRSSLPPRTFLRRIFQSNKPIRSRCIPLPLCIYCTLLPHHICYYSPFVHPDILRLN
jgi:hypothetical protein